MVEASVDDHGEARNVAAGDVVVSECRRWIAMGYNDGWLRVFDTALRTWAPASPCRIRNVMLSPGIQPKNALNGLCSVHAARVAVVSGIGPCQTVLPRDSLPTVSPER